MSRAPAATERGRLRVLIIGGTGTISTPTVRAVVAGGHSATVVNRGHRDDRPTLAVRAIRADVRDRAAFAAAVATADVDVVIDFLGFDATHARDMIAIFHDRVAQYIFISSAAVYSRPLPFPIDDASPVGNPDLPYAAGKAAAEDVFLDSRTRTGFPVTIVRPAHTWDSRTPPLVGGWTTIERMRRGAEVLVHGDGTSLWTLTHADDVAAGLAALVGSTAAVGRILHLTSDDVYSWNEIYELTASALGVEARLRHLTSMEITRLAPGWGIADFLLWDLGHSAVFTNAAARSLISGWAPAITFRGALPELLRFGATHADHAVTDSEVDATMARILSAGGAQG